MSRFDRRLLVVWLVLVAASLISVEVVAGLMDLRGVAAAIILAITFFKVRLVGLEFMEVRFAPLALRLGIEIWAVATPIAIWLLYWRGAALAPLLA